MGTNEKILLGAIALAAGVGGYIYVNHKGGIKNILNPSDESDVKPTKTKRPNPNYTTDTATRTRKIQTVLADNGYLAKSDIDGRWGTKTQAAFLKATNDRGLSPITNETSYLNWLRAFSSSGSGGSSTFSPQSSLRDIALFIRKELTDPVDAEYGTIRSKLQPLTASQLKEVDRYYREWSQNGLARDFRDESAGGKVRYASFNVKAIRDMLTDAGLKGLAQIEILANSMR